MKLLEKYHAHLRGRWLGLLSVYVALMGWHLLTARSASFIVVTGMLVALLVAFFIGDLLLKLLLNDKPTFDSLSFRMLSGILTGTFLLYVLGLALPFGLLIDAVLMICAAVAAWVFVRRGRWKAALTEGNPVESAFLALGLVAVTLWCRDLLTPIDSSQPYVIFPVWQDIFYHWRQISGFAQSAGASTIDDVRMAGVVAHPYHFASYVVPALMVSAAHVSEWVAYASFLVPVGIMLTFLAAYALVAPVFGAWPAAVGALALLVLPDAFQQGFGNPFWSYHWLQQVGPAGCYGVASAALSFALMIEACRSRRIGLIFASYAFLLVTLNFKAHIFVASAFLILVFPALFLGGLSRLQRVVIAATLTCVFFVVVHLSQQSSSVPVLRLDGSSLAAFSRTVLKMQSPGVVKTIFTDIVPVTGAYGSMFGLMLLIITFGIFPVVYAIQLKRLRRDVEPIVWLFPILVVGTFLIMATKLSLDNRGVGMPEELLHRPFVWAYFVIVVWAVASAYRLVFGDAPPSNPTAAKLGAWTAILLTLLVPIDFGQRIQTMRVWNLKYHAVPNCLVRSAEFIKEHSRASDIVQFSNNDPQLILTALSSRKPYAIAYGSLRGPMAQRLQAVESIRNAATVAQAATLARQLGIQWWVIGPPSRVAWRSEAGQHAAFRCEEYQVFRF